MISTPRLRPEDILVMNIVGGRRSASLRNRGLRELKGLSLPTICDALDLSQNELKVWPNLSSQSCAYAKYVRVLYLAFNKLESFEKPLSTVFPYIQSLSLRGNQLSDVQGLLYGLRGLPLLHLDIGINPIWPTNIEEQDVLIRLLLSSCKTLQTVTGRRITLNMRRGGSQSSKR
ncbi:Leucine-rich repeat protein [Giardia muris]|uniref:Leucine-rich repeat protein n=1 Tax=Giardia muris TaxID=5742 RepID=A0A4Z1T6P2_GIAMU|nr:Leucine-rich repeat protein [Giardia muris]|eukprot:TNJ28209.1 Leucine-rich repeat protein [Giardia muris]